MADVLQKVNNSNEYINGAAVVRSDKLGNVDKLAQTINDNNGIASISGILDSRFDDVRYYTGDSGVG
jgi:hypothetical protein